MAAKHTLHVALTEPLVRHVRSQVAARRYATASEVVREALQLLIDRDARQGRDGTGTPTSAARHG